MLKQIIEISWLNLRNVPQRLGSFRHRDHSCHDFSVHEVGRMPRRLSTRGASWPRPRLACAAGDREGP